MPSEPIVLTLEGTSEHIAHVWRKKVIFTLISLRTCALISELPSIIRTTSNAGKQITSFFTDFPLYVRTYSSVTICYKSHGVNLSLLQNSIPGNKLLPFYPCVWVTEKPWYSYKMVTWNTLRARVKENRYLNNFWLL